MTKQKKLLLQYLLKQYKLIKEINIGKQGHSEGMSFNDMKKWAVKNKNSKYHIMYGKVSKQFHVINDKSLGWKYWDCDIKTFLAYKDEKQAIKGQHGINVIMNQAMVYDQLNKYRKQNIPNFFQIVSLVSRLQYQLKGSNDAFKQNKGYKQTLKKTIQDLINRRLK